MRGPSRESRYYKTGQRAPENAGEERLSELEALSQKVYQKLLEKGDQKALEKLESERALLELVRRGDPSGAHNAEFTRALLEKVEKDLKNF